MQRSRSGARLAHAWIRWLILPALLLRALLPVDALGAVGGDAARTAVMCSFATLQRGSAPALPTAHHADCLLCAFTAMAPPPAQRTSVAAFRAPSLAEVDAQCPDLVFPRSQQARAPPISLPLILMFRQ